MPISNELLEDLLPILKPVLKRVLKEFVFEPLFETNTETHNLLIATMYPVLDTKIEQLADGTLTKLDDVAVDIIKEIFLEQADVAGIILPELDTDES